jgi:hypothetical protein
MSCHPRVTEWTMVIQTHLPHLSTPQATVLALWSLGMVLARSGALTAVSAFLATWLGRKEPAVRQQLRALCYEATAKRGTTRCALAVEPCFVPLLAWVVDQWEGTQLALALDATTLGTRFTVLAISVVYGAVPSRWPGASWPPRPRMPGAGSGCACCARCAGQSHGRGPSSCLPIGDDTPAGCFGASPGEGGTRFCASTPAGPSVPRARCVGAP